jgi:hypothetical protein
MNGVFRTGSHARRIGALLASDREVEIDGIGATTQDLNAGPGTPLFPCMLHGTGHFTLPATCALEWVDGKEPVSDHLDHLFSIVTSFVKVWEETPDLFLVASRKSTQGEE